VDDISEAAAVVVLGTEFSGAGGEVLVVDVDVGARVEGARNDVGFNLGQSRVRRVERARNLSSNFGVLFTDGISAFEKIAPPPFALTSMINLVLPAAFAVEINCFTTA